jgi:hypothetical protein
MVLSNIYNRSRNLDLSVTRGHASNIVGHQNQAPDIPMGHADACHKLPDRRRRAATNHEATGAKGVAHEVLGRCPRVARLWSSVGSVGQSE